MALCSARGLSRVASRLRTDRRAVAALEYGLLAAIVALAISATLATTGTSLAATFNSICAALQCSGLGHHPG
jgi:pilus assembly protein Flp/PilA